MSGDQFVSGARRCSLSPAGNAMHSLSIAHLPQGRTDRALQAFDQRIVSRRPLAHFARQALKFGVVVVGLR